MNMCQCLQCKSLNRAINSCKTEMDEIVKGNVAMPPTFHGNNEVWNSLQEERYEHLENFMMSLKFIRDYPERQIQV